MSTDYTATSTNCIKEKRQGTGFALYATMSWACSKCFMTHWLKIFFFLHILLAVQLVSILAIKVQTRHSPVWKTDLVTEAYIPIISFLYAMLQFKTNFKVLKLQKNIQNMDYETIDEEMPASSHIISCSEASTIYLPICTCAYINI